MTGATRRVPELDGLRGVAVLLVLVGHGLGGWADPLAMVGVTLFFVLSGYLITGRLLSGQTLRRFYVNRARRLVPAAAVMLAVTGAFYLTLGTAPARLLEAATYVTNLRVAYGGNPDSPWVHTWSLATEEQFYLLWPLLFGALAVTRRARVVAIAGVVSLALMLATFALGDVTAARYSPLTQAWTLCLGCWLALRGQSLSWAPSWPTWLGRALRSGWLRWFGVRSYGMYLWHYPLLVACVAALGESGRWLGVTLGVGAAVVSWRWVELPWLKRPSETARGAASRVAARSA